MWLWTKIKNAVAKTVAKVATKVANNASKNNTQSKKTTSTTTKNTTPVTIKPAVTNVLPTSKQQAVPKAIQSELKVRSQNAVLTNPTWTSSNKTTTTTKTGGTTSTKTGGTTSTKTSNASWLFWTGAINTLRKAVANQSASQAATNSNTKANTNSSTWWGTNKATLSKATTSLLSKTPMGQTVTAVLNAVKQAQNQTATKNGSAGTGSTQFDHTKQNVNGSPVAKEDGNSILYKDGSVYDKKTWVTTAKDWTVLKDTNQATQVTEWMARWNSNIKSNNVSPSNSSTYNPTVASRNVTSDRGNQAAAGTVIKSGDNGNITWVKSKELWSKETAYRNEDWSATYIAPNGKKYIIAKDEDWNFMFNSQWGESKWNWVNLTNDDWTINNNIQDIARYIKTNNQIDWIDRDNVDNSRAIKWATIEWTYTAPSGKEYDIVEWKWEHEGQVWFVNYKWQVEYYDSWQAAKAKIDQNNPVWSSDTGKNQIAPELSDRWYVDENWDAITGIDALDEANFDLETDRSEREQALQDTIDRLTERLERLEWESDEVYETKRNILNDAFWDVQNYQREMEDALDDLKEKTQLVQDNDRMRWARQRAAQLAAQWYLTSEQVAQVANYSIADYNKELADAAAEAAQKLSQMRAEIVDKKEQYIQAIRQTQYNNENDRQAQLNYANNVFNTMLQWCENTAWAYDQYFTTQRQNNLGMNIQNELWYDSIIRQDEAQKVVDDRNLLNALTNSVDRKKYILSQVQDINLHPYVEKIINHLQSQWKFLIRNWSTEQMKTNLAEQISGIVAAARQAQLEDQKALAS